ncbi:two-component system, OmpR family, phosphate regulon sensor histidine kinase PhoR [Acetitomaculum ruminis DSM 5522]|uniref:histidine kinase n=1 Tax=Acetitomaculum ruminis DSM 5522 TaxID=1120918 RepID=A0A1I0YNE7_9FIRM|nr:HAMP domain-containing sensor histidine kinase [Acetitomaculum ruminis]SFB13990.1 two-component system, OmpR family, phosphate regulon sensor histidine kinase PhoR [Acetitomaculum ruminis DSM 5522]
MNNENKTFKKPLISQVDDLTLRLLEANKKIKEEEKERLRMLSDIAHDLRAPVNAFRSSLDYIISMRSKNSLSDEELDSLLEMMDKRTLGLQKLISDLYFLLTLEQQAKDIYHFEEIDLGCFLEEYFFDIESRDEFKDRELSLNIPQNLNCRVKIDMDKMVRALDNLFYNALKYSSAGAKIFLKLEENSESFVIFSINDTGIGIEKCYLDKIFEHSFQVSKARTPDSKTGSGLGLTIVKTIIETHSGKIWCESNPRKGSSFFIRLNKATH